MYLVMFQGNPDKLFRRKASLAAYLEKQGTDIDTIKDQQDRGIPNWEIHMIELED